MAKNKLKFLNRLHSVQDRACEILRWLVETFQTEMCKDGVKIKNGTYLIHDRAISLSYGQYLNGVENITNIFPQIQNSIPLWTRSIKLIEYQTEYQPLAHLCIIQKLKASGSSKKSKVSDPTDKQW